MEKGKRFNLYIDESGIANLATKGSQYFVLTGLIIEEGVDQELSAYFNFIKKRYKIDGPSNFHAADFFEIQESEVYTTDTNAKKFSISLGEFVETIPFKLLVCALDKEDLRKILKLPNGYRFKGSAAHAEDKDIAYEILARKLIFEFARHLSSEKALGAIIAESRRGSDRVLLRTFNDCQEPALFASTKFGKTSECARQKIVSIRFENKQGLSGGLELVDIYSYITYQTLTKRINRLKKRGCVYLWEVFQAQLPAKKRGHPVLLSRSEILGLGKDRINKISNRIQARLNQFRDFVNPTSR
jgi:hypothetical protein